MCFTFYTEIQDGHQKWRESDFLQNVTSTQHFVEIALSRTVSEINALLRFTQNFKMTVKSGGKAMFCKKSPVDSTDTLQIQNFVEIVLSCTISKINALLGLHRSSRWPLKSG